MEHILFCLLDTDSTYSTHPWAGGCHTTRLGQNVARNRTSSHL